MRNFLLTLAFLCTAFVVSANNGTNGRVEPDLSGGVIDDDNKRPISNVSVTIISHDTKEKKQVTTDNNGSFSFNDIKAGMYKVVFYKEGYKKIVREKVYLRDDDNPSLTIELDEAEEDFQLFPNILLGLIGNDD